MHYTTSCTAAKYISHVILAVAFMTLFAMSGDPIVMVLSG